MSTSQVEGVYSVCLNTNWGIVVCSFDYADRFPEALADLGKWIAEGRIVRKYHIVQGLERAPEALSLLFTGDNTGKLSVPLALLFQLQFLILTPSWRLELPRVVHVSDPEAKAGESG
jgi:hypothetical protein